MEKLNSGEHLDPAFTYTDDKIKPINARIKKLAEAHDALATEQKAETLRTQRFLANFMVVTDAQLYRNRIDQEHYKNMSGVVNQLVADTTRARTEIRTSSKDPITIAVKFSEKWQNNLKDLGFPSTQI